MLGNIARTPGGLVELWVGDLLRLMNYGVILQLLEYLTYILICEVNSFHHIINHLKTVCKAGAIGIVQACKWKAITQQNRVQT